MTFTVDEVLERLKGWKQRMVTGGWWAERDEELFLAATILLAEPKGPNTIEPPERNRLNYLLEVARGERDEARRVRVDPEAKGPYEVCGKTDMWANGFAQGRSGMIGAWREQRDHKNALLAAALDVLADPNYPLLAEHNLRLAVEAAKGEK